MEKRTKRTLASAIGAALATSAVVAGLAVATPAATPAPKGGDTDNIQYESQGQADDATEVNEPKGENEGKKGKEADTDDIQYESGGQESGENGN